MHVATWMFLSPRSRSSNTLQFQCKARRSPESAFRSLFAQIFRAARTQSTRHNLQRRAWRARIVFPKWEHDLVPNYLVGPCCAQFLGRAYKLAARIQGSSALWIACANTRALAHGNACKVASSETPSKKNAHIQCTERGRCAGRAL